MEKTSKWLVKINATPIQFRSGVFITIIRNCYSLSYIQNEPDGWCLLFNKKKGKEVYDEDNKYVWRANSTFWNRYFTKENYTLLKKKRTHWEHQPKTIIYQNSFQRWLMVEVRVCSLKLYYYSLNTMSLWQTMKIYSAWTVRENHTH